MTRIPRSQFLGSFAMAVPYLLIAVLTVSLFPGASWRYDPTSPLSLLLVVLASVAVPLLPWLPHLGQGVFVAGTNGTNPVAYRSFRFALIVVLAIFFTATIIQPLPAAILAAVAALGLQAVVITLMGGSGLTPPDPEGHVAAK